LLSITYLDPNFNYSTQTLNLKILRRLMFFVVLLAFTLYGESGVARLVIELWFWRMALL